ncbi:hypothetical protein BKA10_002589 [Microbacterium invictum]|uniref:Uncharacterized protein n=1 Tax=Microbacterium invictum TaxID=515415 RepID=A0AA40SQY0_9MICO|nr:hypothetical protein [Microbacterium invictum]
MLENGNDPGATTVWFEHLTERDYVRVSEVAGAVARRE